MSEIDTQTEAAERLAQAEKLGQAERLSAAIANLDPATQKAMVNSVMPAPSGPAINQLWLIFIGGLSVALLIALLGGFVLAIDGKTTEVAVTAFTSLLAGLLGLFAPSPTSK
jgi:hypothetical protein